MHPLMLSFAACFCLVLAGTSFAQSRHIAPKAPTALRVSSAAISAKKVAAKPVAAKASVAHSAARPAAKPPTQSQVRAARYGGFLMAPPPPPPSLDTTSPRTLSLVNVNTDEALVVTYWSDGAYRRDALDKLNHFLRDSREGAETEMDPLLFDVLWHTQMHVGFSGAVEILSAYRSPTTNAWLASVSRGVASDSQHMHGNAMDISMPGVPVFKIRRLRVRWAWAAWASIRARASSISIPGPCATGSNGCASSARANDADARIQEIERPSVSSARAGRQGDLPIKAALCVMLRSQRGKSFHRQRQSTVHADDEPHPYKRVEMLGANHRGISALDMVQGGKVDRIYKCPWATATGHGTSLPCLLLTKITPPLQMRRLY